MAFCDLFLGGSQKATETNKPTCVLEQPAYMTFLNQSTNLLTIFKGLNWKLLGGIVCTYWWNGPIKTEVTFRNSVVQKDQHLCNRIWGEKSTQ